MTAPSLPSSPRFTAQREQWRRVSAGERLVPTGSTGSGSYQPTDTPREGAGILPTSSRTVSGKTETGTRRRARLLLPGRRNTTSARCKRYGGNKGELAATSGAVSSPIAPQSQRTLRTPTLKLPVPARRLEQHQEACVSNFLILSGSHQHVLSISTSAADAGERVPPENRSIKPGPKGQSTGETAAGGR